MRILGVSAFYHDSAAALVVDGRIVAAAQEERFTRRKHDDRFPAHAILACLDHAGRNAGRRSTTWRFTRSRSSSSSGCSTRTWPSRPRGYTQLLGGPADLDPRQAVSEMAASRRADPPRVHARARRTAPLRGAPSEPRGQRILSVAVHGGGGPHDGRRRRVGHHVGQHRPRPTRSKRFERFSFPHSLGLLYSAFTYYTGFKVNSGRVQGDGARAVRHAAIRVVDARHADRRQGGRHVQAQSRLFRLLHRPADDQRSLRSAVRAPGRQPDEPLEQFHMDVAASIQAVTDEIMLRLTRALADGVPAAEPLPRRRRGAQLRRQRQGSS